MSTSYRVFLGAPTASDLRNTHKHDEERTYKWQTVSSDQSIARPVTTAPSNTWQSLGDSEVHRDNILPGSLQAQGLSTSGSLIQVYGSKQRYTGSPKIGASSQSVVFPLATLEAASRRISLIYKNIIFDDDVDEEEDGVGKDQVARDETTLFTWPPTAPDDLTGTRNITAAPSFLLDASKSQPTRPGTQAETQESQSYNYSDTSSIVRFPSFHFALNSLTSLSSLPATSSKGSRKVNILLAVLEAEGPDTIRIKKGSDAGKEVAVLKLILGDEEGCVCKLTAWREVAEDWGGIGDAVGVKRGDVLYIANVTANWDPTTSPTLTASPYLNSSAMICYRTMPYTHEDNRLRPDLRLGESDAAVRKVAAMARWFEGLAGLGAGATAYG